MSVMVNFMSFDEIWLHYKVFFVITQLEYLGVVKPDIEKFLAESDPIGRYMVEQATHAEKS